MAIDTQPKKRLIGKDILISCLLAVTLIFIYTKLAVYQQTAELEQITTSEESSEEKFGFDLSDFVMEAVDLKKGDILGSLLRYQGLSSNLIQEIEFKSKEVAFDTRSMRPGKKLYYVKEDECEEPIALVYEPSNLEYVVYDLREGVDIKLVEKEVSTCIEVSSGKVTGSLWNSLKGNNIDTRMISRLEDALASSVDFYHTQRGDEFRLIYEKKMVDGEQVGIGNLLAAYYKNSQGEFYSYYYENGEFKGYYDEQGRPSKAGFLKAPVKHVRISSSYNLTRFHPVLKKTIPHLGTDYAAPYGTPIIAVADGVIEAAAYTGGNGKFVKIKHDKTYQTQYLHMQTYAQGIRKGARVKQGQTIGYVGSTGLATGPHVCFRFWKDGRQVNPLRHKFDPPKPMNSSELPKFELVKTDLMSYFDQLPNTNLQYAKKSAP